MFLSEFPRKRVVNTRLIGMQSMPPKQRCFVLVAPNALSQLNRLDNEFALKKVLEPIECNSERESVIESKCVSEC